MAGPWCLVVDCLGEVSRQVLGYELPRLAGLVDGRNLAEEKRSHGTALAGSDGLLSVARPREGPMSSCEALPSPAAGAPPPAKDHRASRSSTARRRAYALLAMPREPPGLLLCLPSLGSWPLRLGEMALRCSSSLAFCKRVQCLFQHLIANLSPVTLQGCRPASYNRKGVKDGPYKVDGRAAVSRRRLHRRSRSASS